MTKTTKRHPRALTSLVIVRDHSEFNHRSAIRSVALFHVSRDREQGARFALDHHAVDRETPRADVLEGIAARVARDATLIAPAPQLTRQYVHSAAAQGPTPPADLQLLQRLRADLDILPLECRSAALDEIGAAFALQRAGVGSSVLARCRKAPAEAQCVWLSFLWTLCGRADRMSLTSAWEAWRALQRARPLPF